ncbi:MAG: universal stress protein [Galactobacter sp.]|uniref:universal stress protein n=1 Tax=Galactobacter sp. TaxID=2676125 RepID=UPI0025C541E9|nr:universal stress protein [Galactobacter sp.]
MSTYIVGVDGSDTAYKAAERAAELAEKTGDKLVVLSAHSKDNTEVVTIGSDTWILDDSDQAGRLAERISSRLREDHPNAIVTSGAIFGKPVDALINAAKDHDAQVIFVGNVGTRGLGRVLGSVATGVIHNAECDVYVVRTAD